jgi:hypothetical protein
MKERMEIQGPLSGLDERAARDSVGMEVYVFVEEVAKHVEKWVRDSVGVQPDVIQRVIGRNVAMGVRDEVEVTGRSP